MNLSRAPGSLQRSVAGFASARKLCRLPLHVHLYSFAGSGRGRPNIHGSLNLVLGAIAIPDQQDVTAPKSEGGKMACT
jgi:hypothetical protein